MKREKDMFEKCVDRYYTHKFNHEVYCASLFHQAMLFKKMFGWAAQNGWPVRIYSGYGDLFTFSRSVDDVKRFLESGTVQLYIDDPSLVIAENPFASAVAESSNGALFLNRSSVRNRGKREFIVTGPVSWWRWPRDGNEEVKANMFSPFFSELLCCIEDQACLSCWKSV